VELAAALLLLGRRTAKRAAAGAGLFLVALTALFYVPILVVDIHGERAIECVNYVFDTLLFAATVLRAGLDDESFKAEVRSP
jgi:hypothetical protein